MGNTHTSKASVGETVKENHSNIETSVEDSKQNGRNLLGGKTSVGLTWPGGSHGHGFHFPHVRLPSFHGSGDHSTSCQVLVQLASQPGFKYTLDQFERIRQIGSGAFGRVLLCKHTLSSQKVVLKVLEKRRVVCMNQQHHVLEERNTMKGLAEHHCPFVVRTMGCFQDDTNIYFVMEYIPGGELFAHLQAASHQHFSEKRARFYVCEAILALQHLHEKEHIVYRDIKPENMLLDEHGHLKLVDFGFAKHLETSEMTYTFCGTSDYISPEVVRGKGCGMTADYWALGVLTFELLAGYAPFLTHDKPGSKANYEHVLAGEVIFPKFIQGDAHDFILSLLQVDPKNRLGTTAGIEEIKAHPWFSGIDWEAMRRMEVKPPKLHRYKKGTVNILPCGPANGPGPSDPRSQKMDPKLFLGFEFVAGLQGSHIEASIAHSSPLQMKRKPFYLASNEDL